MLALQKGGSMAAALQNEATLGDFLGLNHKQMKIFPKAERRLGIPLRTLRPAR